MAKERKRLKKNTISYDKVARYATVQIKKWGGRASHHGYTYLDLRSEAYKVFLECKKEYVGESRYGPHFFSLFKTALFNHFYSSFICWYDKDRKDVVGGALLIDESGVFEDSSRYVNGVPIPEESSFISRLKTEAPDHVIEAITYMFNTSQEELIAAGIQGKGKHGFSNNTLFCEVLGYDPSTVNILDEVRKFIVNAD